MTEHTCRTCGEPSKFSLCGRCLAERQQHQRDKARRRHEEFVRRMESRR